MKQRLNRLIAVCGLIAATACGDARLRKLDVGIGTDSLFKIIADGTPAVADTIKNVYRHSQYLVDGRMIDVYLFDADDRKHWTTGDVADKELTPIVVLDGKLEGWGWGYMDEITTKYKVQVRAEPKN